MAPPLETPLPTLTEEDIVLFNNLATLLIELLIAVYRENH